MLEAFNRVYQDARRGTRVVDVPGTVTGSTSSLQSLFENLDDDRLDHALYEQLVNLITNAHPSPTALFIRFDDNDFSDPRPRLSPHVRHISKLESERVIYGTRSKNIRNSFVCFRDPSSSDPSLVRAGQISHIFLHRRLPQREQVLVEPFIMMDEYVPLSSEHTARDPYRRFPLLNTKLFYNRFHERKLVIRPSDIVSHFAMFVYTPEGIEAQCVVVRSLDRVSAFPQCGSRAVLTYWPLELSLALGLIVVSSADIPDFNVYVVSLVE